jgi:hypothetical protein
MLNLTPKAIQKSTMSKNIAENAQPYPKSHPEINSTAK